MPKCVRCGYCCRVDLCPYGKWNEETGACTHLEVQVATPKFTLYRCGIYAQIVAEDRDFASPGFGRGCPFEYNEDRRELLSQHTWFDLWGHLT